MTLVEVLCLNHRSSYGIVYTSDVEGSRKFDVCMAAGHRMFHFYGGIQDPTPYAWVHPMNDFEEIENAIKSKNFFSSEYKLNLVHFLETWQELVSNGFTPEWFLFHPEQFFGTDDLKVNIAPQKRRLIEIMDTLGIEEESHYNDSANAISKERDKARERKQAFFDMQKVDRKGEGDILMYLRKWQKSKNTEQRWLGVMAMTHYLRGGLTDFDGFYDWLCKNLADASYLIRAETLDMLQSLVITDTTQSLNLIEKLNSSKRFALQIAAFDLARRLLSGDFYYGQRYHEQLIGFHKSIDEKEYPRFKQLCSRASKNQKGWLDRLHKMKAYEHFDKLSEDEISFLNKGIEDTSSPNDCEQYVARMSRLLAKHRLSIEYFQVK